MTQSFKMTWCILTPITLSLMFLMGCQTEPNTNKNTPSNIKYVNNCTTEITNRPQADPPFSLLENGEAVEFTYHDDYNPTAYENDIPNYNATFPGRSFFILFGDGRYSWSQKPIHEYKVEGNYDNVFFELTRIKDGDEPPLPAVNPLINDNITVCSFNANSTTNDDFFLEDKEVAFKESRPAYCGYTFVEIIKIGHDPIPAGALIDIDFSNESLAAVLFAPYRDMPFNNDVVIDNTNGKVSFTTNSSITSETPIFLQFKNKCPNDCTVCDGRICVSIFKDKTRKDVLTKNKCREFNIKTNDPFDPNWLETGIDECYGTVPSNSYQKHHVNGYFYFVDNNSGDTLNVTVKVRVAGNTSIVHALEITGNNSTMYNTSYNANNKEITFTGLPSTIFVGQGNNSTDLPDLGHIDFDLVLNDVQVGDVVTLEIESIFEGLAPYTNTLEIPIRKCRVDPSNIFPRN